MPDGGGMQPDYITRAELDRILQKYATHSHVESVIANEWVRLKRRLGSIISDAMTACARGWMPDNPAHLADASQMLKCISAGNEDTYVRDVEAEIVAHLRENAPVH